MIRSAPLSIAAKDATETWRDGRFRWAAALAAVLIAAAIAGGTHNQSQIARQHAHAQAAERDAWLDKGDMNPHAAAHYGAFVFKPVQPLSAIDPGLDPFVGVFVFLEAHKQQLARFRPIEDATPTRRLGELTPASAAVVLLPLLVIALTFSSFAGERELGTLRPLMAAGVGRASLLAGKALGALLPLVSLMVPAVIAGMLFVAAATTPDPLASVWTRGLGLIVVFVAHTLIWVGLGLAVSARARSQGSALVILLSLWFANAFVAGPLSMAASKWLVPSPGAVEFTAAIADEKDRWPSWDERVEAVTERFLAGEFDSTIAPANIEVVALVEAEAEETALYERHFARLFEGYLRQSAIYERAASAAPTVAARTLSMALAGTDHAHDRDFSAAAARYRSAFLSVLNNELAESSRFNTFDYVRGREFWEKIPPFDYDVPGAAWAIRQHAWSVAVLAAWVMASAAAAVWSVATLKLD